MLSPRENRFAPNISLPFCYLFLREESKAGCQGSGCCALAHGSLTQGPKGAQQPQTRPHARPAPPAAPTPHAGTRSPVDVVDEPAHLALPLLGGQPRVGRQVLHHVEVVPHFVREAFKESVSRRLLQGPL